MLLWVFLEEKKPKPEIPSKPSLEVEKGKKGVNLNIGKDFAIAGKLY